MHLNIPAASQLRRPPPGTPSQALLSRANRLRRRNKGNNKNESRTPTRPRSRWWPTSRSTARQQPPGDYSGTGPRPWVSISTQEKWQNEEENSKDSQKNRNNIFKALLQKYNLFVFSFCLNYFWRKKCLKLFLIAILSLLFRATRPSSSVPPAPPVSPSGGAHPRQNGRRRRRRSGSAGGNVMV